MLLWFRNDLRTHDNPALHYFLEQSVTEKKRKAIFFISEEQWRKHHWSEIKIDFVKRHAYALVNELLCLNIELEIINVPDFSSQVNYHKNYCRENKINRVFANSELELNEQLRDQQCIEQHISLTLYEADVIVPKGQVLNQSNTMFKVFTPFKKAWLKYVYQNGFEYLGKAINTSLDVEKSYREIEKNSVSIAWPLAASYEKKQLPAFIKNKVSLYSEQRDIPSIKGTSGISPYLAAGVISPRYILVSLLNYFPDLLTASDTKEFTWLNEIIWREFYRNLMHHEQRLCKHQCFQEKYQCVQWHNKRSFFKAWCEGNTGYPLVDAAMRQLNQTGWMHNRLRMVTASFLTKHLLIDWRWGEKYFMQHLIDGDLASNNGGWQWAASTGCDAQPYFRIFNPIRQSERFDPNGVFIRKYIPELENVPDKYIHFPQQYIESNKLHIYVKQIVEHKQARLGALAFYNV